ncbi:MAG TPA: hypothetical protein VHO73_09160 [Methylomirabilota bacterium]|nr:hypothetical protein [Methylomirabilota bacterium]
MTLQRAGTPTVVVTTTAFETLAHHEAHTLGMETLPLLVVDHPIGGEPAERIEARAACAASQLLTRLGAGPPAG